MSYAKRSHKFPPLTAIFDFAKPNTIQEVSNPTDVVRQGVFIHKHAGLRTVVMSEHLPKKSERHVAIQEKNRRRKAQRAI